MYPCSYLRCRGAQSGGTAHCSLHHTSMHVQVLKLLLKLCHHFVDLEDGYTAHTHKPHQESSNPPASHPPPTCNETVLMHFKLYLTDTQQLYRGTTVAQFLYLSHFCICLSPSRGPLKPAPCPAPAQLHPAAWSPAAQEGRQRLNGRKPHV